MQPHPRKVAPRLFGIVHMVLWAGLAAWLAILLNSLPRMSEARAIAERERAQELIAENQSYCTKWGLVPGTHEYTLCTMDVQEIRAKHERRLAETIWAF
jgi:hypothetical protein